MEHTDSTLAGIISLIKDNYIYFWGSSIPTFLGFIKLLYSDVFEKKKSLGFVILLAFLGWLLYSSLYIIVKLIFFTSNLSSQENNIAYKILWFCGYLTIILFAIIAFIYYLQVDKKSKVTLSAEIHQLLQKNNDLEINKTALEEKNLNLEEQIISLNQSLYILRDYQNYTYYKEGYLIINEIFERIHSTRRLNTLPRESLTFLCDVLSDFFSQKTSSLCSVCIKVISPTKPVKETELEVQTYCRDTNSSKNRSTTHQHLIKQNTSFSMAVIYLTEGTDSYIENNLPTAKTYLNSSFKDYGNLPKNFKNMSPEQKQESWTLPYKSEIVATVFQKLNETDNELVGFLCLDSNKIDVFDETYDLGIIRGISNGIFEIVKKARNEIYVTNKSKSYQRRN